MFQRIFISALAAGFLAGLLVTVVQFATTGPIILEAERYESGEVEHAAGKANEPSVLPAHFGGEIHRHMQVQENNAAEDHGIASWLPGGGLERISFTALANVLTAIGFGLLLVAGFAIRGDVIDARKGLLWGLGGFAAFSLAPSLGLPPETPGTIAADLASRQAWWLFAAAGAAAGIWLMVFGRQRVWRALGVLLIIAPHAAGAPHPEVMSDLVPPELAARYVTASLATAAVFWASLGWLAGAFYRRFS